jgi:hypothetical protein
MSTLPGIQTPTAQLRRRPPFLLVLEVVVDHNPSWPPSLPESEPTNAREILSKLVFLPVHPAMTDSKIKLLCSAIREFESLQPGFVLANRVSGVS